MGNRQNLTISLPRETIRKAKLLAAKRETSVTGLVAELVEELVQEDAGYETARRSALAYMRRGFPMGGKITATREDWHER